MKYLHFFLSVLVLGCTNSSSPIDNLTRPITKKPIVTFAFDRVPSDVDNIYPIAHLWRDSSQPIEQWEQYETPAVRQIEYDKIKNLKYKALWPQNEGILADPKHDRCSDGVHQCLWFDEMIQDRVKYFQTMMNELKAQNIKLDELIFDNEEWFQNWTMCQDSSWLKAIEMDPRFPTWKTVLPLTTLSHVCDFQHFQDYQIWNGFTDDWQGKYHQKIIDTVQSIQPGINMSDWQRVKHGKWDPLDPNCVIPAFRVSGGAIGKGWTYGNKGQYEMYGSTMAPRCRDPDLGLTFDYPQDSFHALIYELNLIQAGKKAGTTNFNGVIAYQNWNPSWPNRSYPYHDDIWYREMLFQTLITGADRILYWNPQGIWGTTTDDEMRYLGRLLKEAEDVIGYSDFKLFPQEMIPWSENNFIEQCARANGKKVCRVTPNNGEGAWEIMPLPANFQ